MLGPAETGEHPPATVAGRLISHRRAVIAVGVALAVTAIAMTVTGGRGNSLTGAFVSESTSQRWTFMRGALAVEGDGVSCSGQYTRLGSVVHVSCNNFGQTITAVGVLSADGNVIGAVDDRDSTACLIRAGSREAVSGDNGVLDTCAELESQALSAMSAQPASS